MRARACHDGAASGPKPHALTRVLVSLLALAGCSPAPPPPPAAPAPSAPLATFRVEDPLGHRWSDEIVHFDFDVADPGAPLFLADGTGAPMPTQLAGVRRAGGRVAGTAWTVVSIEPHAATAVTLRAGVNAAAPGVAVEEAAGRVVIRSERIAIALPRWPGALGDGAEIASLPAPIGAVQVVDDGGSPGKPGSAPVPPGGAWIGGARWVNEGPAVRVKEAVTEIVEAGPVRAVVRQRMAFADGRRYEALITLGARQDAAIVVEDSDEVAPKASVRLSIDPGLSPDRVTWHNHFKGTASAPAWSVVDTKVAFDKEEVILKLRPWSFWWYPALSEWVGFHRAGGGPSVGVVGLRPSRWSPEGWGGFDRTEIPVTARRGGGIDLTFALAAGVVRAPDGKDRELPLHREWAIVASGAPVDDGGSPGKPGSAPKPPDLRRALTRYSEFPLDEVKGYGFDAPSLAAMRARPALVASREDARRARQQARSIPAVRERAAEAIAYLDRCGGLYETLKKEGAGAFYKRYVGHYLLEKLPEAYLGSDDPRYGEMLAAAVEGMAQEVIDTFIEAPSRPSLGSYAPFVSETVTRLALNLDLVAGRLAPEVEEKVRRALVLGAHALAHPDFWNLARGLCSSNPNMTSSVLLPLGLVALRLEGHPEAGAWRRAAEAHMQRELDEWISPGGAWIENPYYELASLDGVFLFAEALARAGGRDVLADPKLADALDHLGFLLTPPDPRFGPAGRHPMVLPAFGDAFAGIVSPYNGWMAAAARRRDPAFAARQQFFWQAQGYAYENAARARGFVLAVTDPSIPAAPPAETSRAFPGFGSVMRSSWTDPRASYVAHRTGPNSHHYRDDQGSFVYHAKGAPLCVDWGNYYAPFSRGERYYRSAVSFDKADSPTHWGVRGELVDFRSLPRFLDWSHGRAEGHGGQADLRHLVLVKADDPLGANYLVVRDATRDGQPSQAFHFNLWCLVKEPEIRGSVVHLPGQMGVDLDVHVLAPASPIVETDRWGWRQTIPIWGDFAEEQRGVRVTKRGSAEDFLVVLDPRAPGQGAARGKVLGGGAGVRVARAEGTDWLLLAPGRAAAIDDGGAHLAGGVALARRARGGSVRLALIEGAGEASLGGWGVRSAGAIGLEASGRAARGESSGGAHEAVITLPAGYGGASVRIDGQPAEARREGRSLVIAFSAGFHEFTIQPH